MKNVLITGGAGSLGTFIAQKLIKEGDNVIVWDAFKKGSKSNLAKQIKYYHIWLEEVDYNHYINQKFDLIYHLAPVDYLSTHSLVKYASDLNIPIIGLSQKVKKETTIYLSYFIQMPSKSIDFINPNALIKNLNFAAINCGYTTDIKPCCYHNPVPANDNGIYGSIYGHK